jgi:hypothetical protein
MSENLKVTIIEGLTGEVTERDMTSDEKRQYNSVMSEMQTAIQASESVRASGVAKLAALGLTEEEIAAL